MANLIKLKRSATSGNNPTTSNLELGELAINTYDGNLFFKKSVSGTESILSVATLTGTQTLTNKTLTTPVVDRIDWTTSGTGAPTFTTRSVGTKLTLYPAIGGSSADYAIGINSATLWSSIPTNASDHYFKWYGGTTEVASLSGTGVLTVGSINNPTITGTLTAGGGAGTNGQVLASTGTGVQWITNTASNLDSLTDVVISSPTSDQVLKYNGSVWVNAEADQAVASAVFAANAESDLGSVTDLILGLQEDLGLVTDTPATYIYNLGSLVVDGIVSLNNLDQSVKADYISYAIIFGF
jgi:hypothetical protein